jgi:hypothetical protein
MEEMDSVSIPDTINGTIRLAIDKAEPLMLRYETALATAIDALKMEQEHFVVVKNSVSVVKHHLAQSEHNTHPTRVVIQRLDHLLRQMGDDQLLEMDQNTQDGIAQKHAAFSSLYPIKGMLSMVVGLARDSRSSPVEMLVHSPCDFKVDEVDEKVKAE